MDGRGYHAAAAPQSAKPRFLQAGCRAAGGLPRGARFARSAPLARLFGYFLGGTRKYRRRQALHLQNG